jgi:glycosyltransferase involved in cell wall biosynthesis
LRAADVTITAIILTRDEELHLRRCLERLSPLADRIIVVDSFSTDQTVAIANDAGAEVWQHRFVNHAAQFNWALDQVAGGPDEWIVRVDADEWFEPAAIAALKQRIASAPPELGAFDIRRKVIFRGRWIRWGGYYSTVLTRVWRAGAARIEQRWMDEHIIVSRGRVERIAEGDIVDENLKDITDWTAKHNGYTTRQMVEFISLEVPLMTRTEDAGALTQHAGMKRFLRNGVYGRSPLYLRALLYFAQRYLLRFGILDGRQGLVFHFLQGCWNMFLIDAKVDEARSYIKLHGLDAFRAHLRDHHGIDVDAPPA